MTTVNHLWASSRMYINILWSFLAFGPWLNLIIYVQLLPPFFSVVPRGLTSARTSQYMKRLHSKDEFLAWKEGRYKDMRLEDEEKGLPFIGILRQSHCVIPS